MADVEKFSLESLTGLNSRDRKVCDDLAVKHSEKVDKILLESAIRELRYGLSRNEKRKKRKIEAKYPSEDMIMQDYEQRLSEIFRNFIDKVGECNIPEDLVSLYIGAKEEK